MPWGNEACVPQPLCIYSTARDATTKTCAVRSSETTTRESDAEQQSLKAAKTK